MAQYGFSFGIELTADNVLASYFQDHFSLTTSHAGDIAAVFGLINFVSRPLGQYLNSDQLPVWLKMELGDLHLSISCPPKLNTCKSEV